MIDRVAALADIVAPSPALRPPASFWGHGPLAALLAAAALALTTVGAVLAVHALRRALARRRLRVLARRLRRCGAGIGVDQVLPAVWADLRRAGLRPARQDGETRAVCERLRYARVASPDALRDLLDRLLR